MDKNTFETDKKIAKKLQIYKKLKAKEKELVEPSSILEEMKRLFSLKNEFNDLTQEQISNIIAIYGESKNNLKEEKDKVSILSNSIKAEIGELIMADCLEKNMVNKIIELPKLGKVNCTKETTYTVELKEDEKEELINTIISESLYNLLDINELAYLNYSKDLEEQTGKTLKGVVKNVSVVSKISLSRDKV